MMAGGEGRTASHHQALPPLAGEDHVCNVCEMSYPQVSVRQAHHAITLLPSAVREAVAAIPDERRRLRPHPNQWSVLEYVCHLRDVFAVYTIRLHRARTEDCPVLEPMFNDLRAGRFGYNERDITSIMDELAATAAGFCMEINHNRPEDWNRLVIRLPGEERRARWLVRQAMHEGQHHLGDLRRTNQALIDHQGHS